MAKQLALLADHDSDECYVTTKDVEKPDAGELLVKVLATTLNPADWKIIVGKMASKELCPITLGFDAAGVVEEIGADVTGFSKGDRV